MSLRFRGLPWQRAQHTNVLALPTAPTGPEAGEEDAAHVTVPVTVNSWPLSGGENRDSIEFISPYDLLVARQHAGAELSQVLPDDLRTTLRLINRASCCSLDSLRGPCVRVHLAMLQQALMLERCQRAAAIVPRRQPYRTLESLVRWGAVAEYVAVDSLPPYLMQHLGQCGSAAGQLSLVQRFVQQLKWDGHSSTDMGVADSAMATSAVAQTLFLCEVARLKAVPLATAVEQLQGLAASLGRRGSSGTAGVLHAAIGTATANALREVLLWLLYQLPNGPHDVVIGLSRLTPPAQQADCHEIVALVTLQQLARGQLLDAARTVRQLPPGTAAGLLVDLVDRLWQHGHQAAALEVQAHATPAAGATAGKTLEELLFGEDHAAPAPAPSTVTRNVALKRAFDALCRRDHQGAVRDMEAMGYGKHFVQRHLLPFLGLPPWGATDPSGVTKISNLHHLAPSARSALQEAQARAFLVAWQPAAAAAKASSPELVLHTLRLFGVDSEQQLPSLQEPQPYDKAQPSYSLWPETAQLLQGDATESGCCPPGALLRLAGLYAGLRTPDSSTALSCLRRAAASVASASDGPGFQGAVVHVAGRLWAAGLRQDALDAADLLLPPAGAAAATTATAGIGAGLSSAAAQLLHKWRSILGPATPTITDIGQAIALGSRLARPLLDNSSSETNGNGGGPCTELVALFLECAAHVLADGVRQQQEDQQELQVALPTEALGPAWLQRTLCALCSNPAALLGDTLTPRTDGLSVQTWACSLLLRCQQLQPALPYGALVADLVRLVTSAKPFTLDWLPSAVSLVTSGCAHGLASGAANIVSVCATYEPSQHHRHTIVAALARACTDSGGPGTSEVTAHELEQLFSQHGRNLYLGYVYSNAAIAAGTAICEVAGYKEALHLTGTLASDGERRRVLAALARSAPEPQDLHRMLATLAYLEVWNSGTSFVGDCAALSGVLWPHGKATAGAADAAWRAVLLQLTREQQLSVGTNVCTRGLLPAAQLATLLIRTPSVRRAALRAARALTFMAKYGSLTGSVFAGSALGGAVSGGCGGYGARTGRSVMAKLVTFMHIGAGGRGPSASSTGAAAGGGRMAQRRAARKLKQQKRSS